MAKRKSHQNLYFCQIHNGSTLLLTRDEFRLLVIKHLEEVAPRLSRSEFDKTADQILGVWDRSDIKSDVMGRRDLGAICRLYLDDEKHVENPYTSAYVELERHAKIFARAFRQEFSTLFDDALRHELIKPILECFPRVLKRKAFTFVSVLFLLLVSVFTFSSILGRDQMSTQELPEKSTSDLKQVPEKVKMPEGQHYMMAYDLYADGKIKEAYKECKVLLDSNPSPLFHANCCALLSKILFKENKTKEAIVYHKISRDYYVEQGMIPDVVYLDINYVFLLLNNKSEFHGLRSRLDGCALQLENLEKNEIYWRLKNELENAYMYLLFFNDMYLDYLSHAKIKHETSGNLDSERRLWALNDYAVALIWNNQIAEGEKLLFKAYADSLDTSLEGFKYYHLLGHLRLKKISGEDYSNIKNLIYEYAKEHQDAHLEHLLSVFES